MSRRTTLALAFAVLLAAVALSTSAEVIDDFETNQATLTDSGSSVVTDDGVDVILGDHRELEIELVDGTSATAEAAAGALSFDATAGGDSQGVATVVWDADTNTTVFDGDGLGGVDLTDNDETAFRIEMASASADTQLILEVFTNDGNSSKAGLLLPAVAATTDFFLSYADFVTNLGTGADFADVGAIVLRILGTNVAADIAHFETVGPTLTVTKIDIDPNDDMDFGTDPVVPGDTIRYRVDITNDGGLAQQVDLADTVDGNTTFTMDSLTATPVALVDTVAVLGNVTRTVADPGVLTNDVDPDGDALFVNIPGSDTMSAQGGTIAWNDAGSDNEGEGGFQYFPPAGFRGVDSFAYQLQDADGDVAAGQVTVILDRIIWFVDDNHPGSEDGTLANPFNDFAQLDDTLNDVDRDGDIIFVFAHSGGNYSHAGLELEPGQSLIGEGEGLIVDGTTIVPAGASALIHAPDAGAGTTHGATLTMNNTIRGVTFGDTEGHAITGSNFGTLTVSNTTVTGAGGILDVDNGTLDVVLASSSSSAGPGFGIDLDSVDGSFDAGSTTITGGATGGIRVAGGASGASFDFGAATVSGVTSGVDLASSPMATFTFDSLDVTSTGTALNLANAGSVSLGGVTNTLETTTSGAAIIAATTEMTGGWTFDNVTSDNSPTVGILLNSMTGGNFLVTGATDINAPMATGIEVSTGGARTYDFGSTDISGAGSVAGRGVNLISGNSMSSFVFDSLNVTTDNGAGVVTNGVGLLAIAGATNSIDANNGNALWLESTTVDEVPGGPVTGITFATLSSANSDLDGINLQSVTGSVTGSAGSITGAMDAAVRIGSATNNSGGASNVTYAGSITNTQDFSVLVQERNGGAVTFSGAIVDNGASNSGIFLDNNDLGTVQFTGTVDITGTSGAGVTYQNSGGGTTSFADLDIDNSGTNQIALFATNNTGGGTLDITTGTVHGGSNTAVDIDNTVLGVTLFSATSIGGGSVGIDLASTTGSFTVTGDGATGGAGLFADNNGTGGAITGKTGNGVRLADVTNVSLNYMNLSNNLGNGIHGTNVNGFVLTRTNLAENGDTVDESGLRFGLPDGSQNGLIGSALAGSNPTRISHVDISAASEHNVEIINTAGVLTNLLVENSRFRDTNTSGLGADGFQTEMRSSAVGTINVTGSTFSGNATQGFQGQAIDSSSLEVNVSGSTFTNNNEGLVLSTAGGGDLSFDISNNPTFTDHEGVAIFVGTTSSATAASAVTGRITNNTNIQTPATGVNHSVVVFPSGASTAIVLLDGNTITNDGFFRGINVTTTDNVGDATSLDVTITNNTVSNGANADHAILVEGRNSASVCAKIESNTSTAVSATKFGIRLRERDSSAVQLEQGGSASSDPATVLDDNNPASVGFSVTGAPAVVANNTCTQVP